MQSALAFELEQEGAVTFLRDRPKMLSLQGFENWVSAVTEGCWRAIASSYAKSL